MTSTTHSTPRRPLGIFLWAFLFLGLACAGTCFAAAALLKPQAQPSVPLAPDCAPEVLPPASDRIVFTSERDGHSEIYAMKADGSDQLRLTDSPIAATSPSWSPDGKKIFFISQVDPDLPFRGDPFMMNTDGSGQTKLTAQEAPDSDAGRSPDGKLIVSDDGSNIYVTNADGSGRKQLTSEHRNRFPTWSPDGSLIAFVSFYGGSEAPMYTFLYIVRPDGTGLTKLMENVSSFPSWSPDGARIAVLTGDMESIYVIKADGSGAIRIPNGGGLNSPAWSPDGEWLAFDTPGSDSFAEIAVTKSNLRRLLEADKHSGE